MVHDPHLTAHGKEQAAAAGSKIQSMIKDKKVGNIRVVSSPFVRCLMTAEQIALKIGAKHIEVDPFLSEMLSTKFFQSNPMEILLSHNI